ncbi:MAG: mechanosensitive ion channel family protein [Candidatus Spyradocola sp.]
MDLFNAIPWTALLTAVGSVLWMVVKALFVLVAGYFLTRWLLKFTGKFLVKSKLNETLHSFLLSCIRIVCYVFIIIMALTMLGIPTTSLITAIGTAGVAIGLALKDSLSNFASGVIILFNAPFQDGDFVEIGGQSGVVQEIGLMTTKLKTFDNRHIIIPNNTVTTSNVVNYSREKLRRLDMDFTISYDDNADRAIELIRGVIASKGELVLREPAEPFVMVTGYLDSSVKITVRVWCKSENYWDLNFAFLKEVRAAFDANNIHIPYNQLDVHVVNN